MMAFQYATVCLGGGTAAVLCVAASALTSAGTDACETVHHVDEANSAAIQRPQTPVRANLFSAWLIAKSFVTSFSRRETLVNTVVFSHLFPETPVAIRVLGCGIEFAVSQWVRLRLCDRRSVNE
jgi:hypothetical protein